MSTDPSTLSDQQLLGVLERAAKLPEHANTHHYDLQNTGLLTSGARLTALPTYKFYQGHIGVGVMRDHATGSDWFLYVGYTTYGPSNYPNQHCNVRAWTADLDEAIAAVNKTVRTKMRKGYESYDTGADPLVTRDGVMQTVQHMLDSGLIVAEVAV